MDQYTLPRPYVHAHAPSVQRETGREDSSRRILGLEAIQVLGQLSNDDRLESIGVKLVHSV